MAAFMHWSRSLFGLGWGDIRGGGGVERGCRSGGGLDVRLVQNREQLSAAQSSAA